MKKFIILILLNSIIFTLYSQNDLEFNSNQFSGRSWLVDFAYINVVGHYDLKNGEIKNVELTATNNGLSLYNPLVIFNQDISINNKEQKIYFEIDALLKSTYYMFKERLDVDIIGFVDVTSNEVTMKLSFPDYSIASELIDN